jgi:hypothetical protein
VPLNDVFISAKIARGRAFGVAPSHCNKSMDMKNIDLSKGVELASNERVRILHDVVCSDCVNR